MYYLVEYVNHLNQVRSPMRRGRSIKPPGRNFLKPCELGNMSSSMIKTISPIDGSAVVERKCHTPQEITAILQRATEAFKQNKLTPLSQRIAIANKFLDLLAANKDSLVDAPHDSL